MLTSRIPKYAISGLRSIAAILAFAAGMVAILYAIPTIYGSFNIVYLSTNIEFHQYVIRIWPPTLFLLLIYMMISLSLKISPIKLHRKFVMEAIGGSVRFVAQRRTASIRFVDVPAFPHTGTSGGIAMASAPGSRLTDSTSGSALDYT